MDFNIGDYVTRNSYNNDIIFRIIDIDNDICYLKGFSVRLCADSNLNDLSKCDIKRDVDEENEFIERIKEEKLDDRGDYFYLPGKILHIDTDNPLSNNPLNPYFIRKNDNFDSNIKSLKKQKNSNFSKMYCTK